MSAYSTAPERQSSYDEEELYSVPDDDDPFADLALPLYEAYERYDEPDPEEVEKPDPGYRVVSERGVYHVSSRGQGDCEGSGFRGWKVVNGVPEPTDWGACPNRAFRFGLCGPCAAYAARMGIEHVAGGKREVLAGDEDTELEPLPAHGHRSHLAIRHADIRQAYAQGRTQRELAEAFEMSTRQIRRIVAGIRRGSESTRRQKGGRSGVRNDETK